MGKRSDIGTTWSDVVQTWFLDQPTTIQEDQGWSALGTLERLAPERIDKLIELPTALPIMMSRAIRLGIDLGLCEPCKGFKFVLNRVRDGEHSAISEIMWGALLIRKGYLIELEPPVGQRLADTLITTADETVYAELIAPVTSDEAMEKLKAMRLLASRLKLAIHRIRLELHLSEDPRTINSDELVSCITRFIAKAQSGNIELNVGIARWEAYRSHPTWGGSISPSTDITRFGVVNFNVGGPNACLAKVTADISDGRVQRMIGAKRKQLDRENINLVVANVTAVAVSIDEWEPLIRRRLQPNINTRIGGVVMMRERCEKHKVQIETRLIQNPHARRGIPASLIEALR